ncbi:hypothetical protein HPC49_13985 [Pyxidicoccus fallax]|uniref:Uncharacterized protein n=1 Tax=Pyxidicoccus fallax TaxID=394095 RepID=A0A848LLZ5_9BACT|nr:HEAT repeat domain-containing protein [Pyxidicoccus fallax]NMO18766.1 hypothetical protein [Pyxidicoccus fallax]NPC79344.1 hypothetical protein [Pyxidicoccus fallax]
MARSLLESPSAPEFPREFQERHLSELAFLLTQRRRQLHDAGVEWPDLEPLEVRILRHVEAMQASGDVAAACAREALDAVAEDELTAGIHALVSIGDGLTEVMERMAVADASLLPCFTEALLLAQPPRLTEALGALLSTPRPEVRATAARILGQRHEGGAALLLPLLDDAELEVRAAAALAVSELGHRPALALLERKLSQSPADELDAWALASLRFGSARALQACRQAARAMGAIPPRVPWLLALAGDAQDFGTLSRLCPQPGMTVTVLEALGILGAPASVPLLLEHLSHDEAGVRAAAAEALTLMTGAGLVERVRVPDEDAGDAEAEEDTGREVTQASTDAAAWDGWWEAHRTRLEGASRLRLGQPYSPRSSLEELAHPRSPFKARARAALELDVRSGQPTGFQPDWPVQRQCQSLARWQREWAERPGMR